MLYRGQSYQDLFALEIVGKNGIYLEIGACLPQLSSNTYVLEVYNNWKGISIELDTSRIPVWEADSDRKNKVYWDNALTFDYADALLKNDLTMKVNYLSCDIEPPSNTFLALQRVIDQGITFDCITFEHDLYACPYPDYNVIATDYLATKGYKPAVTNVFDASNPSQNTHFETWFVKNEIEYPVLDFRQWINKTFNGT